MPKLLFIFSFGRVGKARIKRRHHKEAPRRMRAVLRVGYSQAIVVQLMCFALGLENQLK